MNRHSDHLGHTTRTIERVRDRVRHAGSASTMLARAATVALFVASAMVCWGAGPTEAGSATGAPGMAVADPSSPWTSADFVAAWGVVPVAGETGMTLFRDAPLALLTTGEGLLLDCPEFYWIGLHGSSAAGGGGADGEEGTAGVQVSADDETASGVDAFDAIGTLTDFVLLPIPQESSTITTDVDHATYGMVTITLTEMWIAGTLTGTTGLPHHITGLLGVLLIDGTGLPNGAIGALVLSPHATWHRAEDAHVELLMLAEIYAAAQEAEIDAPDAGVPDERPVQHRPADCEAMRAYERWLCHIARIGARTACHSAHRVARIAADAALAACLNGITLQQRLDAIGAGIQIGACIGGGAGLCIGIAVGAPAGGVGAIPIGATGATVGGAAGACIGGLVAAVTSGAAIRAGCHQIHVGALAAAAVLRAACMADAESAHTACVNAVMVAYNNCVAGSGQN